MGRPRIKGKGLGHGGSKKAKRRIQQKRERKASKASILKND